MHILITGATGFIGTQYILRHSHHRFTLLSRQPKKAQQTLAAYPKGTSKIRVIQNLAELPTLDGIDAILNLAGEAIADRRWTVKQKAEICNSRWQLTQQLVDLIKQSKLPPKVFLSGSAIGYYGDAGSEQMTENTKPAMVTAASPDFAQTLCQRWEDIALSAQDHCRVVLLRTGIVLGKEAGALAKMLTPFKLGLGGKIASGKQMMSWIHQRDAVNAIEFLLHQTTASGPFNITAPKPVTNEVFTQSLARALGKKALIPVPGALLKLLMGESASLLLASQQVYPEKLLQSGFRFEFTDLAPALKALISDKDV
ncbi:TIGR01777 family oxidoreductase [Simiduia curdlanivorans]|uniref:TIGR01777 family oxidoreductase n=1 Tax=Simiduia curdlanivorans TaxID=1492769 RepID=A0ABV8V2V9_9GAMM|nr:TIGR01777 family oxidoreductase [Simiduia curdlanivorans]MDN3640955.1 TIGR01777 family oxidoreductase [Simiduia curdlanivorans]